MARASFRLFRTGLIGSLIVALAAGGHLAGGGRLPEPAIVTALCAVAMVPVAVLTRFRLNFIALAGLLGVGQLWLHWSFGALSAAAPVSVSARMANNHPGHAAAVIPPEMLHPSMAVSAADMGGAMFAAHAVATLGTALLLARGERALSALGSWLRPLVQLPEPVSLVPMRAAGPCTVFLTLPRVRVGRRLPTRRGPPEPAPAA
ncbi:hypothetical protein [Arthrobacter sp. ES3-54]|uniref:hypothetical protein n=1 Tax=Arthrobacter sp. ES3-54 TaxID=1502991 RepID=UPI0024050B4C|nr:hypothetical protein [Arthrobacter sp. ES3-54]MDF9752934.1 hypothetical protein [Arthrobacter sp. ES3-54]